jgi:hypothetical protein
MTAILQRISSRSMLATRDESSSSEMFSMARIHSRFHIASTFALIAGLCTVQSQAQVPNHTSPVTVEGGTQLPPRGTPMFIDNFEYAASRSSNPATIFAQHGYPNTKATNTGGNNPGGYLYTQQDATRGSRVLVMESRPNDVPRMDGWSYGQTDYYLQLGQEGRPDVIPANAWFQFWVYATPDSGIGPGDKVFYVCRASYPCQSPNWTWMFLWGRIANQPATTEADFAPVGQRYIGVVTESANNLAAFEGVWNAKKLTQNLNTMRMLNGRWYQIKMHMDVSGAQGVWEAWIRESGQNWIKVADWKGGVTPNFTWPLSTAERRGFS